jgi:soluble lytic murein transglycosylase-like protein
MTRLLWLAPAVWLASVSTSSAELIFFANGRSMSVGGYREAGDSIVLQLRSGGEIVCDRSLVARIEPDEIPYPDRALPVPPAQRASGSGPYADLIETAAEAHGVDPRLIRAVIQVESAFHADARSPKGAMGLMQLMPATARQYQVDDPFDPKANIDAGIRHLRSLLDRFEVSLALAAYNAGEAAVLKFGGIPPYRETRAYVSRVLSLAKPGS